MGLFDFEQLDSNLRNYRFSKIDDLLGGNLPWKQINRTCHSKCESIKHKYQAQIRSCLDRCC